MAFKNLKEMEIPNIQLNEVKFEITHHIAELICFVTWRNLGKGIINGIEYPRTYEITVELDNQSVYGPFITFYRCNLSNSIIFLKKAVGKKVKK
jgi:hypothetical protein